VVAIKRIQTGVRMEQSMLKVLKGLAEFLDMSLGDLLEGIVLHAFDNKAPFGPETTAVIGQLKAVYGLTLGAEDSHLLREGASAVGARDGP
jgi:hypothetical protein